MKVEQTSGLVNELATESLGEGVVSQVSYENVVDVGRTLAETLGVDNYVKKISDKIGKQLVSIREYGGSAPDIMMDSWDFGNILEEILLDMPTAVDNSTWQLIDNKDYSAEEHTFVQPGVSVKYYNNKTTFRLKTASITKRQVKDSFRSPEAMSAFFSGIQMAYRNQLKVINDSLIMTTINNFTGETLADNNANRVIKLLTMYNAATGKNVTKSEVISPETGLITDPELVRFIIATMKLYKDRINHMSTLYNIQGVPRFTTDEYLKVVVHSSLDASAAAYLYSDSFNKDEVTMIPHENVPFWQGSGTDYSWASTSKIHIQTASGQTVEQSDILAVMFDLYGCCVCNMEDYSSASFTASANFTNYYYFVDEGHLNNLSQNFIVFLLQ